MVFRDVLNSSRKRNHVPQAGMRDGGGSITAYPHAFFSTPKRKAIAQELRLHAKRMNALFREAARSGIMVELGVDSVKGYSVGVYSGPAVNGPYASEYGLCDRTARISVWVKRRPCEKERSL